MWFGHAQDHIVVMRESKTVIRLKGILHWFGLLAHGYPMLVVILPRPASPVGWLRFGLTMHQMVQFR